MISILWKHQEAEIAFDKGEIPVGAVIVLKNQMIARAHNLTETLNDVLTQKCRHLMLQQIF